MKPIKLREITKDNLPDAILYKFKELESRLKKLEKKEYVSFFESLTKRQKEKIILKNKRNFLMWLYNQIQMKEKRAVTYSVEHTRICEAILQPLDDKFGKLLLTMRDSYRESYGGEKISVKSQAAEAVSGVADGYTFGLIEKASALYPNTNIRDICEFVRTAETAPLINKSLSYQRG